MEINLAAKPTPFFLVACLGGGVMGCSSGGAVDSSEESGAHDAAATDGARSTTGSGVSEGGAERGPDSDIDPPDDSTSGLGGQAGSSSGGLVDWGLPGPGIGSCERSSLSDAESSLLTNIASKAFTWLTGTIEQARYEPVGELANYFGFAALRTEIRDKGGPLADEGVRGSSWQVVLEHLDASQRATMYRVADDQAVPFFGFLEARVGLVNEIWGLKEGQSPSFVSLDAYIQAMGEYESEISIVSAEGFGDIIGTLTAEQVNLFGSIRAGDPLVADLVGLGPYASEVSGELQGMSGEDRDLLTETASKFLAYATGDLEDAVFLPPGKIGNYFGFASYRYEERASASRSGAASFLWGVLDEDQEQVLCQLAREGAVLEGEYIDGRADLISGIYPLKSGQPVDVDAVEESYVAGATSEGRMGVLSAYYFDYLEGLLSAEQLSELEVLREDSTL